MGDPMKEERMYSIVCNCATCGKEMFVPVANMWAYKRGYYLGEGSTKYFCKWSCMRKFEKEYEEKKARRKVEAINKRVAENRRIKLERAASKT